MNARCAAGARAVEHLRRSSRHTRAAWIALVISLVAACHRDARPGIPAQHVLLVTIEGLRAERLSCYLHALPTSDVPSTLEERLEGRAYGLDDLARAGVLVEHAYASSSRLVPALASLHSGRSPVETGVLRDDDALDERERTLAVEFAEHGFATAACISSAGRELASHLGSGFEHVVESQDDSATLAAALDWLEHDVGTGQPAFLWIHLRGPAFPWDEALAPAEGGLGAAREPLDADPALQPGSSAFLDRLARGEIALDDRARAALLACYDDRVRATSERLAAFCERAYDWTESAREHRQEFARTFTVVCGAGGIDLGDLAPRSTRGETSNAFAGATASLDERALRVPLVVHHPESLTGERVLGACTSLEDVLPTVLDVFGYASPPLADGVSLLDDLDRRDRTPLAPRAIVSALDGARASMRWGRWRATWSRWGEGAPRPEQPLVVHDLEADPLQARDLTPTFPALAASLRARFLEWRAQRRAGFPEGRELRWPPSD